MDSTPNAGPGVAVTSLGRGTGLTTVCDAGIGAPMGTGSTIGSTASVTSMACTGHSENTHSTNRTEPDVGFTVTTAGIPLPYARERRPDPLKGARAFARERGWLCLPTADQSHLG
ncbi:hypothetical protein NDU88_001884 [Pleurodeles waltl]|uniref:Uncharacterized protein n=1 Tax=Pleurodeles waltl TaxID=8319 RepID=A0AAV7SDZ5_PLEWA|nr:hypothetical protein NDU88_001884 [Pleurodeles waltl]